MFSCFILLKLHIKDIACPVGSVKCKDGLQCVEQIIACTARNRYGCKDKSDQNDTFCEGM